MFQIRVTESPTEMSVDAWIKVYFRGEDISNYVDISNVEITTIFNDDGSKEHWTSLPVPVEIINEEPPLSEEEYEALIDPDIFHVDCYSCKSAMRPIRRCEDCDETFSDWEANYAI